jgi:enoyl-CoA hydratase/carnithine racemase
MTTTLPWENVMANTCKQLILDRETPELWRVTFNHPPINQVDPDTLGELQELVSELESASEVKVVVLESADPDFFLAHWDISSAARSSGPGTEAPSWIDISQRLAEAPVVSIAVIRGRARGLGSEIALACDMRFASIERAILGQPEVGVGLVPGGGAMERLPPLVGRARALEIVLGSDDFDALTAERYGWINRALPEEHLDSFVTRLVQRLATFDKQALAEAKRALNRNALANAEDLHASQSTFQRAAAWPGARSRARKLMDLGIGTRSDLELRFGDHLASLVQGDRSRT